MYLYELHAAVKVCVYAEYQGTVGNGLHQLGHGNLISGQEDDGWDTSGCTIGGQSSRCIT